MTPKRLALGVVLLVAAGGALAAWRASRPGLREGYAVLDTSVYVDPARDALPVADVVHRAAGPAERPNVVVIVADDLGYGDLGAYGNRLLRTPAIDALAAGGVRFTDFYASSPFCSPSRAGLLTGRYPIRSGITFPIQPPRDSLARTLARRASSLAAAIGASDTVQAGESAMGGLPASEITLPEALRVAGYATGMVGKWHLGDFDADPAHHPRRHGFDWFAGFPHSNDEFPYSYWRDETVVDPNLGLRQGDVTATLTREAVGFIDAHRQEPFFLYVAHKNVHTPLFPSTGFAGRSPAGAYGDSVEELDWSVGEIVRALAARGLLERTLVVFTSDNGPWHLGSPGPLRGRKGQPMEGGQRVPAIAHWPGHVPAGRVVDAPVMNLDLFPTVLRLAGLELPRDRAIDGRDLGPLLEGRETASPHDALFFFHANAIAGARGGPWKYYRWVSLYTWPIPLDAPSNLSGRGAQGYVYRDPASGTTLPLFTHAPLLFDVVADSNESYDVLARHPDEAAGLRAAIEEWETAFVANPRGWR